MSSINNAKLLSVTSMDHESDWRFLSREMAKAARKVLKKPKRSIAGIVRDRIFENYLRNDIRAVY
jgi:hypothetical protein